MGELVHHEQGSATMSEPCQTLLRHWAQMASSVCDAIVTGGTNCDSACAGAKLEAIRDVQPLACLDASGGVTLMASQRSRAAVLMADAAIGVGSQGDERNLLEFDEAKLQAWVLQS